MRSRRRYVFLEGKAAASLRHPAIVEVLDFGNVDGGEAFVAMELLEGQDLRTRIRHEGSMPAVEAVRTLLPILDALGHAVDESLWLTLQRGLEKRSEARWQTSREFAAGLASWLSLRGAVKTAPAAPPSCGRRTITMGMA